jgi:hypothetical protein
MKQLRSLFGVAVVVIAMYLAWKVMPAYYANYEFQEFVESQARIESYSQHSEPEIADVYAKKAAELDIPLTASQIHVQRMGTELTVDSQYDVHIDVPVHPFDLHFTAATKNRRI